MVVVTVPPDAVEKNSVPTTILDACSVIQDSTSLDISPDDIVEISRIDVESDVRKMAFPVIVEKVSFIVESVVMIEVEVVKELPDRIETFPFPVYNEEVVVC